MASFKLPRSLKVHGFVEFVKQKFFEIFPLLGLGTKTANYCYRRYLQGQKEYGIGNWVVGQKYRQWDEVVEEAADGLNISLMEWLRTGDPSALRLIGLFSRALQIGRNQDTPLLVYISHPYSDDPEGNVEKVRRLAIDIMKRGHIPIAVHLMFHSFDTQTNGQLNEKHFLEADLWLINLCDVVFVAGNSPGVLLEFAHAAKLGKKIINSVEELPKRKWDMRLLRRYLR